MGPRTSIRGNDYEKLREIQAVLASMGPRTSIRGNALGQGAADVAAPASMGPRTSIRGNTATRSSRSHSKPLQWGRGLPSAETSFAIFTSSLETRFNGAADFHPRKHGHPIESYFRLC